MDELVDDKSNEYKSYSSNGGEGRMERFSFGSLGEWRNEERNEKKNKEQNEEGNQKGDSHILANGRCF